ncbi:MAG: hypothetical protein M3N19_06395 [Candidatus Eremiobacteraeota bacterium]|nr:hypothetical protein [Candidatus Eremiobacteraeota bacterium]
MRSQVPLPNRKPAGRKKRGPAGAGKRKGAPKLWVVRSDRVLALKADAHTLFPVIIKLTRIVEALNLSAAADVLGID